MIYGRLTKTTMSLQWTLFTRKIDPFIDPHCHLSFTISYVNIFATIFTSLRISALRGKHTREWHDKNVCSIFLVLVSISTRIVFAHIVHHALCFSRCVSLGITINKAARIHVCLKLFFLFFLFWWLQARLGMYKYLDSVWLWAFLQKHSIYLVC